MKIHWSHCLDCAFSADWIIGSVSMSDLYLGDIQLESQLGQQLFYVTAVRMRVYEVILIFMSFSDLRCKRSLPSVLALILK
jgi:hypothetical protein